MEAISTFNSGMNSDVSKLIHSKDSYAQSLNFRGLTELGESNGSKVNVKGNECKIIYPELRQVFKVAVKHTGTTTASTSVTLTINGQSTIFTISATTTGVDLYNIVSQLSNCYNNPNAVSPTFSIANNNLELVIYQQPVYTGNPSTGSNVNPVITISNGTGDYQLQFKDISNAFAGTVSTPYIDAMTADLITIGSTFLEEDIYLFTCPDDPSYSESDRFNDTFTKPGQIWKLSINDNTKQHTLTLLYNNNLDFTKYHPIPPSAATGRYENDEIKRIYWSDFYNKIRTVNVADEQLFAINATQLSVTPSITFSQPLLKNVINGSLLTGCYQIAYRLKKNFGSVSNFSELSNMVYLYPNAVNNDYYAADPGGSTSKGLTFKVDNVDTTFDTIEFAVLFRESKNSVPVISIKNSIVIPVSGSLTVDITDLTTDDYLPLLLSDFLIFSGTFTHAKTCETKDNRLFWGNVKITQKDLNFEARAFRAKTANASSTDIVLTNQGITNSPGIDLNTAINLYEESDCINEYYNPSTGQLSGNGCYFKPDTAAVSGWGVLGGKGKNISYEFGTFSVQGDDKTRTGTTDPYQINNPAPFRTVDSAGTTTTSPDIILNDLSTGLSEVFKYDQQGVINNIKVPYKNGLLKGYQHEETYRFAIQFFDLDGNPFFAKWVGDIKFPGYSDYNHNPDSNASSAGINDFRMSYDYNGKLWLQVLYIKFDVTIPDEIKTQISGFQFVRTERTDGDCTILGSGIITSFIGSNSDPYAYDLYLPSCVKTKNVLFNISGAGGHFPIGPAGVWPMITIYPSGLGFGGSVHLNTYDGGSGPDFIYSFDSYDLHYRGGLGYSPGDKLLIRNRVSSYNYTDTTQGYWKLFDSGENKFGNPVPNPGTFPFTYNGPYGTTITDQTEYDNYDWPFFLLKFKEEGMNGFSDPAPNAGNNYSYHNYSLKDSKPLGPASDVPIGGRMVHNWGRDFGTTTAKTSHGMLTQLIEIDSGSLNVAHKYGCIPVELSTLYKMIGLYFRPNTNQYGGNTYTQRANSKYHPCSEFVPTVDNLTPINGTITDFKVFGGDVYTCLYDMQKVVKAEGVEYKYFKYSPGLVSIDTGNAQFSTSYYIPCTARQNAELRFGNHINTGLTVNTYSSQDDFNNNSINQCENNTKTYFPKPAVFKETDKWINRVYWSEVKINGETEDSWSKYLTDDFYDVEGNYGEINALIILRSQMFYIQERGFGRLLINPVSLIGDNVGREIKLGGGSTIERHDYLSIDVGTKHQWSVYNSQNSISFVDIRQKKLYMFNGESLTPISDTGGQRNFLIKRLHGTLNNYDNPIIGKGILTTFDYLNNEYLITFNNNNSNPTDDENYTISFSEASGKFDSMYSFVPNIYINNHKYLLSTNNNVNSAKIYLHNFGKYGTFYEVLYPSTLKIIINDNPLVTKVFDNLTWLSDSIKDNIEWSDDNNIYPGAPTSVNYPDNVNYKNDTFTKLRCYNDYQNSDWVDLITAKPNPNLRRIERGFNTFVPRNRFDYDLNNHSNFSIFDPTKLTKALFGERLRDKYLTVDLYYPNTSENRFIVHNLKTIYRISDR